MTTKKTRQNWLGAACLLEEQSNLPWERSLIVLIVCVIFGFFIWSRLTPVDELVVTTGELQPETRIVTVEAGIAGIVQDILVTEGSVIKANQNLVKLQVSDTLEEIKRYKIQKKGLLSELEYLNKEIKARKALSDEGLFPSLNLLQLYAKRKELENKLEELNEASRYKFGSMNSSMIRAPIAGQIQEIRIPHRFASIHAGETLMEIVPLDVDLFADLKIKPSDIGHVHVGQSVVLRVTTFDVARYSVVTGMITYITPATIVGREGLPYYKARVTLSRQFVNSLSNMEKHKLKTGMMVDAEIKTGTKTIMEYLLKPVMSITHEALHER